jgi:predicted Zn-dependent peptidase
VAQDLLERALAPGHPLSRPVLGDPDSLRSIDLEDLRGFHRRYVTGRKLVLTVVGPVEPAEVVGVARDVFRGLAAGEALSSVPPPPLTPPGRTDTRTLGQEQAYIGLGYLLETDPADAAALRVAGALLSDRLSFELRERQGLAYALGAGFEAYAGRTRFAVWMGTRQESVERALAALRAGVAEFRDAEPDPDAVRRAANALRGRLLMRRLTGVNQAYFAGLERLPGAADAPDLLDALLDVDAEQVRRAIRRHLDPDRCATVVVR